MASAQLRAQWTNPGNILDILLLVGGDVVQAALAQYCGDGGPWKWYKPFAPVVFSFGWVAYGFMAIVSVVGTRRLTPPPDVPCIVINADTGYARENQSWMLGRLLRDFEELYWMDPANKTVFTGMLEGKDKAGLCISVYKPDPDHPAKIMQHEWFYYFGYLVIIAQLVVSALPWIFHGGSNWIHFVIVLGGSTLAIFTANLWGWGSERFACRQGTKKTVIITRGNAAQHALVVLGRQEGQPGNNLDLEDLAGAGEGRRSPLGTCVTVVFLSSLWVVLLISVDGLQDHTWYLVAAGAIGSIYTAIVAGRQRRPKNVGIPLSYANECFAERKVMNALMRAEIYMPGLGLAMLDTFFPGSLFATEEQFWDTARELVTLKQSSKREADRVKIVREGGQRLEEREKADALVAELRRDIDQKLEQEVGRSDERTRAEWKDKKQRQLALEAMINDHIAQKSRASNVVIRAS